MGLGAYIGEGVYITWEGGKQGTWGQLPLLSNLISQTLRLKLTHGAPIRAPRPTLDPSCGTLPKTAQLWPPLWVSVSSGGAGNTPLVTANQGAKPEGLGHKGKSMAHEPHSPLPESTAEVTN